MKNTIFIAIVFFTAYGCKTSPAETAGVAGIYVRKQDDAVALLLDTIEVKADSTTRGRYLVYQHSSTTYKEADAPHPYIHNDNNYTGTYDEAQSAIHTEDPGIVYYFDSKTGSLKSGPHTYNKVE